jgi:type II secretory pathway component PulM
MSRGGTRTWETAGRRWLARRSRRERALLAAGALALAAAVGAWGVWLPLTADLAHMRSAAAQSRAALAKARLMTEAIPALARTARPAPTGPARAAVAQAAASMSAPVPGIEIDAQDERVRATFPAVPMDALVRLIESLQRESQLQLIEARLTARVDAGSVRAELVFGR